MIVYFLQRIYYSQLYKIRVLILNKAVNLSISKSLVHSNYWSNFGGEEEDKPTKRTTNKSNLDTTF